MPIITLQLVVKVRSREGYLFKRLNPFPISVEDNESANEIFQRIQENAPDLLWMYLPRISSDSDSHLYTLDPIQNEIIINNALKGIQIQDEKPYDPESDTPFSSILHLSAKEKIEVFEDETIGELKARIKNQYQYDTQTLKIEIKGIGQVEDSYKIKLRDIQAEKIIFKRKGTLRLTAEKAVEVVEGDTIGELKARIKKEYGIQQLLKIKINGAVIQNDSYKIKFNDIQGMQANWIKTSNRVIATKLPITRHVVYETLSSKQESNEKIIDEKISILEKAKVIFAYEFNNAIAKGKEFRIKRKCAKFNFFNDLINGLKQLKATASREKLNPSVVNEKIKLMIEELAKHYDMTEVVTTSLIGKARAEKALIDVLGKGKLGEQVLKEIMGRDKKRIAQLPQKKKVHLPSVGGAGFHR